MSKGGGKGGSSRPSGVTTTTQNNAPWEGQIPYLQSGYNPANGQNVTGIFPEAFSLYENYTPQYFPTSTVSPLNSTQQQGLEMEGQFGVNGSSATNSANNALTAINSGALLGPNPYLNQTAQSISDAIMPQVNSQFAGAGRYGSGANQYAASSAIANAVAPLAFNDYETQVGNILKGSAEAPLVQSGQESAIQDVLNAGASQQQQSQAELNDQINRFNFQQQLPYNKLATYASMINGNYGGTSTLTQPYFAQSNNSGKSGIGGAIASVAPYIAKAALAAA